MESFDRGHGRLEIRCLAVIEKDPVLDLGFPYIEQIFKVHLVRADLDGVLLSEETVFGITSASPKKLGPKSLLEAVRGHWCIENSANYVKDVTFNEDRCRIRLPGNVQAMSLMRNLSINVLRILGFTNMAEGVRNLALGPKSLAMRTLGLTGARCGLKLAAGMWMDEPIHHSAETIGKDDRILSLEDIK